MYKNNFDCSSTGLNIEVSACYDTSYADIIFSDMYTTYWTRHHGESNLYVRTGCFDMNNIPTTVGEVGYFKNNGKGPITKETMVEILNEYREYCYDTESFTMKELREELGLIDIRYVPDLLHNYGEYYHLNDGVALYVSRGYCQGDIANVLCSEEVAKNYWNIVDHELWDCPVSARVTISGCEYDYYDFDGCEQYEWCKEQFVNGVVNAFTNDKELQERLRKQLNTMLPDELEVV